MKSRGEVPHLYYPQMNQTRIINSHAFQSGGGPAFDPEGDVTTANLIIWLDAASYDGTTDVWEDKTTEGNDFTAVTGYEAAVVSGGAEYLSADVVEFSDTYLTGPNLSGLSEGEMFVLFDVNEDPPSVKLDAGGWKFGAQSGAFEYNHIPFTNGTIYDDFGNGTRRTLGNPSLDMTSPRIFDLWSAASDWGCKIDNVDFYTTASNTVSFAAVAKLGTTDPAITRFHQGRFHTLLFYDGKLSADDRTAVYNYLDGLRA